MSDNRTLGTIAGAVIGYFTGGASYVALGATLGGVVGGALDGPTKTEGPRIDDQKVTVSTYGIGIPTVYGTVRIGGNVVDSTDKIELPFTTSSGGKGGGEENTSYRYFVHMRHVLCATPLDGSTVAIRKIWQDGKLIYDVSSGVPIGSALATAESPYSNLILYQGAEDQLPDGIEELYHGVGNVPAYRGVVSVRLNIIECPGGRVPQFSFELARGGIVEPVSVQQISSAPVLASTGSIIRADGVWEFTEVSNGDGTVNISYGFGQTGSIQPTGVVAGVPAFGYPSYPVSGSELFIIKPYSSGQLTLIDLSDGSQSILYNGGTTGPGYFFGRAAYDSSVELFVVSNWSSSTNNVPTIISKSGAATPCDPVAGDGMGGVVGFYGGVVYVVTTDGVNIILSRRTAQGLAISAMPDTIGPATSFSGQWSALHIDQTGIYLQSARTTSSRADFYKITTAQGASTGSFELLGSQGIDTSISSTISRTFYGTSTLATVGPFYNGADTGYKAIRFNAITPVPASVADILEEQCVRAGMALPQFDVLAIDDQVWGYTLTNPASARANIQPLMTAFAIDATEEDAKIRFFHRADLASVGTVSYDELASAEDGGEPGDPMPLSRGQEAELPRSVSVSYINKDFDYQTGTEKAMRQVTESVMDSTLDLPMSVGSSVAATLAQRALYDAWNDRNRRSFKVSRKFAFASAGDVLTFEYPRGTFSDWRLNKVTDTGALIEGECVPANAAIYSQTAIGGASYSGQVVPALPAPTRLQLLDIPLLRDIDNNAGLYAAMDSFADAPASAELLVGDDDNTLTPRGTVSASAPIGFAETALAGWVKRSVDETNIFTVNLGDDVFNSVTRDVLLANGGEFWALGSPGRWEIGCSALGANLGNGRYILSRHLRGLFGTEYLTGTHQVGDTFVLLRIVGILRPSMSAGDIGLAKSYRAVTKGRSMDSAPSQTYASTAEGLKPMSPVNLRRTNANDLTVDRRSRLSMNNSTGTLPLGESTEAYSWSFYTSGAFTTLIGSAVTSAATITSAQITAAGAAPTATLYVRVAQVSDTVGKGHELQATA